MRKAVAFQVQDYDQFVRYGSLCSYAGRPADHGRSDYGFFTLPAEGFDEHVGLLGMSRTTPRVREVS